MKPLSSLVVALIGLSLVAADVEARGGGGQGGGGGGARGGGGGGARAGGGGGGGGARTANRGGGGVKRSPATGSKVQRPATKPASRPAASKPAAKPATRPAPKPATKPSTKPSTKPATRPGGGGGGEARPGGGGNNRPGGGGDNRPGGGGDNRPGGGGDNRPGGGSDNRPGGGGDNRPGGGGENRPGGGGNNRPGDNRPGDNRPNADRPNAGNRPNTLPGMVGYPNRPGGNKGNFNNNNLGNRTNIGGRNNVGNRQVNNLNQVNINRRNNGLARPATLPAGQRNWNSNQWGGNRGVWGNNNNVNVRINNNFRYNNNFAYRPGAWGGRPWWGAGHCHGWHHGHWGYGYNSAYWRRAWYFDNDDDFAKGFMWGIAAWSLGNSIYKMGYQSYSNPYPAPPVQNTTVVYTQPLSVSAAAAPIGDEAAATTAETKSNEAMEKSRAAFKMGDYPGALKSADEAIAATPDDVTLHEYRALIYFALGKYTDAAGVLNPVLASGPGWGWDTMIAFYDGSSTYNDQLRKLEAWVKGTPDKAEGHFVLGYHYLVCGHMEKAYEQFDKTAQLQPADGIARQLRDLTKSSLPDQGATEVEAPAKPAPIPSEKLVGTWTADASGGKVTFKMEESGSFTWIFTGAEASEMKGTWGLDDKGLLVLTADDSQMVSDVTLDGETKMKFMLVGGPEGDPGMAFTKG